MTRDYFENKNVCREKDQKQGSKLTASIHSGRLIYFTRYGNNWFQLSQKQWRGRKNYTQHNHNNTIPVLWASFVHFALCVNLCNFPAIYTFRTQITRKNNLAIDFSLFSEVRIKVKSNTQLKFWADYNNQKVTITKMSIYKN